MAVLPLDLTYQPASILGRKRLVNAEGRPAMTKPIPVFAYVFAAYFATVRVRSEPPAPRSDRGPISVWRNLHLVDHCSNAEIPQELFKQVENRDSQNPNHFQEEKAPSLEN